MVVPSQVEEDSAPLVATVPEGDTIDDEARSHHMTGGPPMILVPDDDLLPLENITEAFWAPSHHVLPDSLISYVDDDVKAMLPLDATDYVIHPYGDGRRRARMREIVGFENVHP
ncbi:hypothetical protein PG988_011996 [Apiospora saccharicola]